MDREVFLKEQFAKFDPILVKESEDRFKLPCSAEGGIGTFFMMLLIKKLNDHNYIYSNKKINVVLLIDFEYH